MISPKVTVLMSVYNGEKYLEEAVNSILNQTFKDFEFIIINDGSFDDTLGMLELYDDPRILLVTQENAGLTKSLNKGLALARGEYIARMDADDISLPGRLEKQVNLLDREPSVGVCGTLVKTIDSDDGSIWNYPAEPDTIRCRMIFESVIAHPSVMIRRSFFEKYKLYYDENLNQSQDYALWVRCAALFDLKNVSEVLLRYRIHHDQVGRKFSDGQRKVANFIRKEQLENLGIKPDKNELDLHERLSYYDFGTDREFVEAANLWLMKLRAVNRKNGLYPDSALEQLLAEWWYMVCDRAAGLGIWVWNIFWLSPLSNATNLTLLQKTRLLTKCVIKPCLAKYNLCFFILRG